MMHSSEPDQVTGVFARILTASGLFFGEGRVFLDVFLLRRTTKFAMNEQGISTVILVFATRNFGATRES